MKVHGLHVLADDDPRWSLSPPDQARAACLGGARVVQLRAKHATDRQCLVWGEEIREVTRSAGVLFVVNDRFDLALAVEADGVHLGQGDLPPDRLPEAARRRLIVGRSNHTPAQLEETARGPVDYLAFGPLFGTTSKAHDYDARGIAALEAVVRAAGPRPVVAIGGIGAEEAGAVRRAGAAGFAVISAVAGSEDPAAATRALVAAWEAAA